MKSSLQRLSVNATKRRRLLIAGRGNGSLGGWRRTLSFRSCLRCRRNLVGFVWLIHGSQIPLSKRSMVESRLLLPYRGDPFLCP